MMVVHITASKGNREAQGFAYLGGTYCITYNRITKLSYRITKLSYCIMVRNNEYRTTPVIMFLYGVELFRFDGQT